MKKLLIFPLTAGMALALSLSALAGNATGGTVPMETDIPVTGIYQDGSANTPVYSVDITWGNMAFTYLPGGKTTWDPTTHSYKTNTGATANWSYTPATETELAGNQVCITNHSNASVKYTAYFFPSASDSTWSGAFSDHGTYTLPSAEGLPVGSPALTDTINLNLMGTLPSNYTSVTDIGKITLTLEPS